jgi:hypothetical protein
MYQKNNEYSRRVIPKREYERYLNKEKDTKIHQIFQEILNTLPPLLKKEAIDKGLNIIESEDHSLDLINLQIIVKDASNALENAILEEEPFIICE